MHINHQPNFRYSVLQSFTFSVLQTCKLKTQSANTRLATYSLNQQITRLATYMLNQQRSPDHKTSDKKCAKYYTMGCVHSTRFLLPYLHLINIIMSFTCLDYHHITIRYVNIIDWFLELFRL